MGPMPLGEGKAEKQFVEIAKAFMRRQVKNCLGEDTNSGKWRRGPWKGNCAEQICSYVQGQDSTWESCSQTVLAAFKLRSRGYKGVHCNTRRA